MRRRTSTCFATSRPTSSATGSRTPSASRAMKDAPIRVTRARNTPASIRTTTGATTSVASSLRVDRMSGCAHCKSASPLPPICSPGSHRGVSIYKRRTCSRSQGTLNENALATKAGVEGSLIAAYRSLDCNNATNGNWGCAASNWPFGSITSDDAYKGSEASDQPQATKLELYVWSSDQAQDYLDRKWASMYEGVRRANATIQFLEKVSRLKPIEISRADSMGIRGEALFLRAHYHFEAWRMWGNIPYYFDTDTTPVVQGGFRKANNLGADSVPKLIIADLNAAIALLPDKPRNGQAGRVTSWGARAYKGRVLVYMHQYAAAVATLDSVVTSNAFGLETSFDHVWTGFHGFANGKETILAYESSVNDGEPNGNNANYGERLNFPHSGSPFKCCGFHQPSQNLANFFAVDGATGLPKAFTSPATWNNRDSVWVASPTDTVDPRLDWTIGRNWVPYKDWGLHDTEAKVETNDLAGAQAIVNQIRARAAVAAQGCGAGSSNAALVAKYPVCTNDDRIAVPLTDPSIRWATYKVSPYTTPWPDQPTARNAVRIERRLELAMEGQRLFDLRRYGGPYAQQVMTAYLTAEMTPARRAYKGAQVPYATPLNDYYPIPQVEIDLSTVAGVKRLAQNPGW